MQTAIRATDNAGVAAGPTPLLGILDRDPGLVVVLAKHLRDRGWEHRLLPVGISARALANSELEALIVDLTVVGEKPWGWLRRVCQLRPDLSIVVCTRSSSVAQRVFSLRLGVDDWLAKPCHPSELIARVEAATGHRHRRSLRAVEPFVVGELEVRPDRFQVLVAGRSAELTPREYRLLEFLSLGGGEVQERERIYAALWGHETIRNTRSVDVCIHKLRRKLEQVSPGWRYIQTHYGVGYRLVAERLDRGTGLGMRAGGELRASQLAA
jgi:DNA-binding response OmpR family regulator